jgi:hypothetical protein
MTTENSDICTVAYWEDCMFYSLEISNAPERKQEKRASMHAAERI